MQQCLVGIDDTDSRLGRCTTHLAFLIVDALRRQEGCVFRRYPRLVRLNPNVPFKTRGNAAVCIEFECESPERPFEAARSLLVENADVENGANSGLVFLDSPPRVPFFRGLYRAAIMGLVNHRRVLKALADERVRHVTLGNGMGVVGAAASLGFDGLHEDHTFELVAYRKPEMCGRPRSVGVESVKKMERETFPHTFNSYDHESGRVLLAPHGPDPVFLGIRGDSPGMVLRAFKMLEYEEGLAGHMIYLSNQCTDAHLSSRLGLPLSAYSSGWLEGVVDRVESGQGGHLYIDLTTPTTVTGGSTVRCAVYEPAGDLCKMARVLARGDSVRVFGGVRRPSVAHPAILNVEKVQVLALATGAKHANPICDRCAATAKSEGRDKGFQCRRCGRKFGEDARRLLDPGQDRRLVPGVYLPSPGAQRHLTKQLIRCGRECHRPHPIVGSWVSTDPIRQRPVPVQSPR